MIFGEEDAPAYDHLNVSNFVQGAETLAEDVSYRPERPWASEMALR